MERSRFLKLAAAVLTTVALVSTSVWATTSCHEKDQFLALLPGVNCDGTLNFGSYAESDESSDGDFVVITALVNTCTGKFCFSTRGCVVNESCYCQFYSDENFFLADLTNEIAEDDVYICSSCYVVSKPCKCISRVCYSGCAVNEFFTEPE